jgi:regulator of sigma E protease
MGPKIFKFRRKNDETEYTIRLFPIGGMNVLAGEEVDDDKKIPKEMKAFNKTWWQRFSYIVAGAMFNFLLAILFLFLIGLFFGAPQTKPYIGDVEKNSPAYTNGIQKGDLILSIDGKKVSTWDDVAMELTLAKGGKTLAFELKKSNGDIKIINVSPKKIVEKKTTTYKFGIVSTDDIEHGLIPALKFTGIKFWSIIKSMVQVLCGLITGHIGLNSLAGPVGIYNIVGQSASAGFENIVYLIAFLSINVGFVNLLPFPAFDGGRILFLIIEKIKGSKVDPKVENIIHAVGFILLMILMLIVTIHDIQKLF